MRRISGCARSPRVLVAAAVCTVLAGCGGGGDEGGATPTFSIGGVLSGLGSGRTLVLQNNAGDDLRLDGNGAFQFATKAAAGTPYAVTVMTQPPSQTCVVERGSGTVQADVQNVGIVCTATGSDGGGGAPDGEREVPLDMALVAGDWYQDSCVAVGGGRSARNLVRLTATGASSVSYGAGVVLYEGLACGGAGSLAGVTTIGNVVFDGGRERAPSTAYWGLWTTVTTSTRAVFLRKDAYLCVLGDQSPSILPTVALAESAADLSIRGGNCYQRR